jgi:hypothetical protein
MSNQPDRSEADRFLEATARSESLIHSLDEADIDYDEILAWAEEHLAFDDAAIDTIGVAVSDLLGDEDPMVNLNDSDNSPAQASDGEYRGPADVIQAVGELIDRADVLILGLVFLLRYRSTIDSAVERLKDIGITVNGKSKLEASVNFRKARESTQNAKLSDS